MSLFELPPLKSFETDPATQDQFKTTTLDLLRGLRQTFGRDKASGRGFPKVNGAPMEWTLYDRDGLLLSQYPTSGTARLEIQQQRSNLLASLEYRAQGIVPGTVNSTPERGDPNAIYQPEATLSLYSHGSTTSKAEYSSLWGGWTHTREWNWLDDASEEHTPDDRTLKTLGHSSYVLTTILGNVGLAQN